MKAAVCRAFKAPLSIEEVELAEPRAGEVKVRIAACAICHSDILFIEGAWGGELPAVLGHEAAGIVEAGRRRRHAGRSRATTSWSRWCAPAVTATSAPAASARCARPGCRSICARRCSAPDGSPIRQGLRTAAFAEQVVVHASQVAAIPREVPLESASPARLRRDHRPRRGAEHRGDASWRTRRDHRHRRRRPQLRAGRRHRRRPQRTSRSTCRTASSRPRARLGASHTINPGQEDVRAAVRSLTDGRGADYVFVAAGSAAAIEQAAKLRAPGRHAGGRRHDRRRRPGPARGARHRRQRAAHPGQQDGLGAHAARRPDAGRLVPAGPPQA